MPIEQTCSASGTNRYITTAIPYVNAVPHIGFALEAVQADALARLHRSQGYNVRLQAGTDENSIKNVQAAEAAGLPVAELVERNAARFLALKESLDLSYDDFIRTSVDARHRLGVERLWKACFERGDIYKRAYSGLYCTGCEQFHKIGDLNEGRCPEHGTKPELIEEENWFFRLSRYEDALRELYTRRDIEIIPDATQRGVVVGRRRPRGFQRLAQRCTCSGLGHTRARRPRSGHLRLVRRARELPHCTRLRKR